MYLNLYEKSLKNAKCVKCHKSQLLQYCERSELRFDNKLSIFEFSRQKLKSAILPIVPIFAHYSKSQIFVQKFNFDKTPTISRDFHPNFFGQFFS